MLGGRGFVGSAIGRAMRARGAAVASIGRDDYRESDLASVVSATAPDVIVHAAAPPVSGSEYQWAEEASRLRALAALQIPSIVIGSAAILAGAPPDAGERYSEAAQPHPLSPYGHFKHAQEQEALALREAGWPVCVVRLFNAIGAGMKTSLMLGHLVRQIVERERSPQLDGAIQMGDLSAYRDFCHVDDAAEAVDALARVRPLPPIVHVASGAATLSRDLAEMAVARSSRTDIRIIENKSAGAGPARVTGDTSLLQRLTGWSARRSLSDAVEAALAAERSR